MSFSKHQLAFLALVRAGLWEKEVRLLSFESFSFDDVYRLAEEQAVVGLVAAGLEHLGDVKAPQDLVLQIVGETLQFEQQNLELNKFIERLIKKLHRDGIESLLVKGQGIAQCYERPFWRITGDVDLFLDHTNYRKAASILPSIASDVEKEQLDVLHLGMTIDGWVVELHGTLHSQLGERIDGLIDSIQAEIFKNKKVRIWKNGETEVMLPAADNDVIFVFTHILQHFYNGGIGVRQLCDWCRLLWTYRTKIDYNLLESRLEKMEIMDEWKAFAAFAVDWLGMPKEVMPLYSPDKKWQKKANGILSIIFKSGNMGHNRDKSYRQDASFVKRKMMTLYYITSDSINNFRLFPKNAIRIWWLIMKKSISIAVKETAVCI